MEQKRRQERKKGHCECCRVKYDDLDKVGNSQSSGKCFFLFIWKEIDFTPRKKYEKSCSLIKNIFAIVLQHIKEEQHRLYVKDKSHYAELEEIIREGPSAENFVLQIVTKATMQGRKNQQANRQGANET